MKTLCILLVVAAVVSTSQSTVFAQEDEFYLDPLGEVIVDMQVAGGRLSKLLTDKQTQRKQQDAVEKLDSLITLLEQQRRRGGGMGGGNPDRPLDDERIVSGPGGMGPLHAARRNGAMWGELPPHKRQEILQSMTEGFPPHYRQILERYYRRLADETPAGEAATDMPIDETPAASSPKPAASQNGSAPDDVNTQ